MNKIICVLCIFMLMGLSSCATARVDKQEMVDGTKKCTASYSSLFKDIERMKLSACDANGNASSSQSDSALLEAIIGAMKKMP